MASEPVFQAAIRYVAAGLSVIPIAANGSKAPDWLRLPQHWDEATQRKKHSWKPYQIRPPQPGELAAWQQWSRPCGIAVVGGIVSGGNLGYGLEIIDIDNFQLAGPWMHAVESVCPGLLSRLVRVRSPRPGLHVYYRCTECGASQKLASAPETDQQGELVLDNRGKPKKKTLIELKGEGGYCVVPPSPGSCHRTGRPYVLEAGSPDLTNVPIVTEVEREVMLETARSFNKWVDPPPPVRRPRNLERVEDGNGRPGDDFNHRGDWRDILEPHGWVVVSRSGHVTNWRRPGKADGMSATTGYCESEGGLDLLYVFSSNAAPFESDQTYSKFAAYALLECENNFTQAASQLWDLGYGSGHSDKDWKVVRRKTKD
jgi:Bifunctional DNA primase/polymerase, N-terminal